MTMRSQCAHSAGLKQDVPGDESRSPFASSQDIQNSSSTAVHAILAVSEGWGVMLTLELPEIRYGPF